MIPTYYLFDVFPSSLQYLQAVRLAGRPYSSSLPMVSEGFVSWLQVVLASWGQIQGLVFGV